ncbi:hypothetical protein PSD2002_0254 [Escherichia phage PSD2002]|nr:hypothetical protein PSD2002_0254 [Escherichia phage PSD2002]
MMKMYKHDFHIGDGRFGNVEWDVDGSWYTGTMYATSEYSEGVSWAMELDDVFASSEEMLEYVEQTIRENNT